MTRSIEDATFFAATWQNYLSTPSRLHYAWMGDQWSSFSPSLFPGFLGLALVAFAIVRGAARDGRVRMCLAVGVAGVLLSFGGKLPGYALLYNTLPLLHSIRMTSRLGYLGIVAVAAVAGFGVVELRRLTSPRAWKAIATGACRAGDGGAARGAARLRALRRHPADLRPGAVRAGCTRRRAAVSHSAHRVAERGVSAELDSELAPARERLQRLCAAQLRAAL